MDIKEIALKLFDLPKGEFEVKTKLGNIRITHIKSSQRNDFRQVIIKINDELYDELTYSTFDYFHLWEKIHLKNNDQKYILKREMLENKNEIQYIDENDEKFVIQHDCIYNYNNSSLAGPSYIIYNGVFAKGVTDSDNMAFIYNLETDKKLLYIKKNSKNNSENNKNLITIKGNIKNFISKYNTLVSIINANNSKIANDILIRNFTNGLSDLVESYAIPTIDIEKVEKLDKEIDKYVNIYKEYAPKLTKTHSDEMLKTLELVATTLENKYNSNKDNNVSNKSKGQKEFQLITPKINKKIK